MNSKTLLTGGMAVLLSFGALAACGDGVDQDNGISDGTQKDAVDQDSVEEVKNTYQEAKDSLKEIEKNVDDALKEEGIGDGKDQDNGVSDGEKKDAPDANNP